VVGTAAEEVVVAMATATETVARAGTNLSDLLVQLMTQKSFLRPLQASLGNGPIGMARGGIDSRPFFIAKTKHS